MRKDCVNVTRLAIDGTEIQLHFAYLLGIVNFSHSYDKITVVFVSNGVVKCSLRYAHRVLRCSISLEDAVPHFTLGQHTVPQYTFGGN